MVVRADSDGEETAMETGLDCVIKEFGVFSRLKQRGSEAEAAVEVNLTDYL